MQRHTMPQEVAEPPSAAHSHSSIQLRFKGGSRWHRVWRALLCCDTKELSFCSWIPQKLKLDVTFESPVGSLSVPAPQPGLRCLEFPTVFKCSVCFCVPGRGSTGSCRCLPRSWRTSSTPWTLSAAATSRWRPSPLGSVRVHKTERNSSTDPTWQIWKLETTAGLLRTVVHKLVCYRCSGGM